MSSGFKENLEFDEFKRFNKLNGFLILQSKSIGQLEGFVQSSTLEMIKEKKKGFFYENRSPSSYLFILIGDSEEEIKNLIKEIKVSGMK